MTTMTLEDRIAQAREAAAAIAEHDLLRREAESLTALEAHKAALERRDAAGVALDATKAAVKARLAELRDRAQAQRADILETLDDLRRLQKEIPQLAGEIRREQNRLYNAVNELEAASRACGSTLGQDAPLTTWAEVGGRDSSLNSNPNGPVTRDFFRTLKETWPG